VIYVYFHFLLKKDEKIKKGHRYYHIRGVIHKVAAASATDAISQWLID